VSALGGMTVHRSSGFRFGCAEARGVGTTFVWSGLLRHSRDDMDITNPALDGYPGAHCTRPDEVLTDLACVDTRRGSLLAVAATTGALARPLAIGSTNDCS
jgi:hypothetical protein